MSQQPQDSPFRASGQSQQSNIQARIEHAIANRAIQPRTMKEYVEHVKFQLDLKQAKGKGLRLRKSAWNDIIADPEVISAHADLVAVVDSKAETEHYGPTTSLLNCISYSFYDVLDRRVTRDNALIFASGPRTVPSGDFLGTLFEPDYISYQGNLADLQYAVTVEDHRRAMPWPEIESVGEQKIPTNRDDGMGQLKSYLATLKRYRPDIPTVRGFKVHAGQVMLAELNACAMCTSYPVSCQSLEPWVAYVVGLYLSLDNRDQKLQFNATQNNFVHWNVMDCAGRQPVPKYAVSPFYVARAPGRITFASFRISDGPIDNSRANRAFFEDDVKGFWKLSWQQTNARSKEKELLRSLHKDGWIPGLVRLDDDDAGEALTVPTPMDVQNAPLSESRAAAAGPSERSVEPLSTSTESPIVVERVQDILRLASIGEPLSQCGTPRELLYTFYDLLETLIHMWDEDSKDEGVLHRDVSWFNVLYDPVHLTPADDPRKVRERPCITEIMHKLTSPQQDDVGVENGADNARAPGFSPRVLLIDLDHAIEKKLLKENPNVGREKTGTAMFISVELSSPTSMKYSLVPSLDMLFSAVTAVDRLPHGSLALQYAFPAPKGDRDFVAKFQAVLDLEKTRVRSLRLASRPTHRPRHDAESAFWVFLWAAVRALPMDATVGPSKTAIDAFTKFCREMLSHIVDEDVVDTRAQFIEYRTHLEDVFHPALAELYELFENMAWYLSIPWHFYESRNMVHDNHVHVAFRRLLLHFLLTTDNTMLDLKLDTIHPRIMKDLAEEDKERKQSVDPSHLASLQTSQRDSALSGLPESQADNPKKRKAEEPVDRDTGASKRTAVRKATLPQGAQFMAPGAPDQGDPGPNYGLKAAETYDPLEHAYLRTAHALRLKFWKDRQLWFSKGK